LFVSSADKEQNIFISLIKYKYVTAHAPL